MSPVAMAENPALLDPYGALLPAERTLLRKLDAKGPALLVGRGRGWMLGGTRYSAQSVKRLIDKRVVTFFRDPADGHVKLQLNYTGRLIADRIALKHSGPSSLLPPDDD